MNSQKKLLSAMLICMVFVLSGCGGNGQQPITLPTSTSGAGQASSPTAEANAPSQPTLTEAPVTVEPGTTATPQLISRIKVGTYNILYGGGFDDRAPEGERWDNRIQGILEYISAESPDIIGLQELNGWELGDPPNIDQFAQTVNMNGYLALDNSGLHNGLLTKFEILEARSLTPVFGDAGGLYARLDSPFGPINVFNIHFTPNSPSGRVCQGKKLMQLAEPYKNEPTILMGDFNDFPDFSPQGWVNPISFARRNIDQIWVSPAFKAFYEPSALVPSAKYDSVELYDSKKLYLLSDHMPVVRVFNIEAIVPGVSANQTPEQTLPLPLQDSLEKAEVLDSGPFNHCSGNMSWETGTLPVKDDLGLTLTGVGDWSTGFSFHSPIEKGQGMQLDFTFTGNQPEFEIHLQSGEWQTPEYRRFGATISGGQISQNNWEGMTQTKSDVIPGASPLMPGKTYSLFVGRGQDNQFVMVFWGQENPEAYTMVFETFGSEWDGQDWRFSVGANTGEVVFPGFAYLSFDGARDE